MRVSPPAFAALVFSACLAIATASFAGSICGTVRDVTNNQPVPQAALFLFDNADQYTGLYDDSDVNGEYCINNIAVGTYTLQVRVDDYLVATIYDIEVTETPTGVDVEVGPRFSLEQPWPNPASTAVTFRLHTSPDARIKLDVFDVAGRRVYGWQGQGTGTGERTIEWNLRDFNGSDLKSGIYFVRLNAGDQSVVRRFVRLR